MLEKVNMDNICKCIEGWTSTLNTLAKNISKQGEYLSQTFCTSLLLGHTLCTRTHTAFANQHTSNGEKKKKREKKKHPKHYVNCHLVNLRETKQIRIWQQHHKGNLWPCLMFTLLKKEGKKEGKKKKRKNKEAYSIHDNYTNYKLTATQVLNREYHLILVTL